MRHQLVAIRDLLLVFIVICMFIVVLTGCSMTIGFQTDQQRRQDYWDGIGTHKQLINHEPGRRRIENGQLRELGQPQT